MRGYDPCGAVLSRRRSLRLVRLLQRLFKSTRFRLPRRERRAVLTGRCGCHTRWRGGTPKNRSRQAVKGIRRVPLDEVFAMRNDVQIEARESLLREFHAPGGFAAILAPIDHHERLADIREALPERLILLPAS